MAPITTRSVAELADVSDVLHLLFHRNKNQHRSAPWWKWLALLRRAVRKLLREHGQPDAAAAAAHLGARILHLRRALIPGCYRAFHTVVADKRFSALGLVLLASLARVGRIVGGDGAPELAKPAPPAVAGPFEDVGQPVERADADDAEIPSMDTAAGPAITPGADAAPTVPARPLQTITPEGNGETASPPPKKKKQKRKQGDAIDKLFKGLV